MAHLLEARVALMHWTMCPAGLPAAEPVTPNDDRGPRGPWSTIMETPAVAGLRRAFGPLPVWPVCGHAECSQRDDLVLAALDALAAHVALLDEHGVIRAANQHWREFAATAGIGPEAGSGVGTNYLEACRQARASGAVGAAAAVAAVERSLAGEAHEFPYRCDTVGGRRWFRARLVPFDAGDRRGVLITHEDITSRTENKATLAALSRHAAEGVIVLGGDGTIDWVDDALLQMTGLHRELLTGRPINAVLGEDVAAGAVLETIYAAFLARRAGGATVPVLRDDGQVLMVEIRFDIVDGGPAASERYVATLVDVTERRHLEHAIATVADDERQSLAHEVHDGLGHELIAARLAISMAIAQCERGRPELDVLLRAEAAIERAAAMVRSIASGIVPLRRGVPLLSALEAFADDMSVPGVVSVTLDCRLDSAPIGNDADQIFRICQEAVANAVRHARARHVSILLEARPRGVELRVTDDGSGFAVGEGSVGKGLRTMKLRASSMGGRLTLNSAVGQGTVVSCLLGE
jgi:PAS domain S-box-containing protein